MTTCNHCLLQSMRKHAESIGQVCTTKPVMHPVVSVPGIAVFTGVDVFIHPKSVTEDQLKARDLREEPPEYFAAWMASLPDHCCC